MKKLDYLDLLSFLLWYFFTKLLIVNFFRHTQRIENSVMNHYYPSASFNSNILPNLHLLFSSLPPPPPGIFFKSELSLHVISAINSSECISTDKDSILRGEGVVILPWQQCHIFKIKKGYLISPLKASVSEICNVFSKQHPNNFYTLYLVDTSLKLLIKNNSHILLYYFEGQTRYMFVNF